MCLAWRTASRVRNALTLVRGKGSDQLPRDPRALAAVAAVLGYPAAESDALVNDYLRSRSKLYLWFKNALIDTQMFYFRSDLAFYTKGEENVKPALQPVIDLDKDLKAKGIALEVFISPYEVQLRPGVPEPLRGSLTHSSVSVASLASSQARSSAGVPKARARGSATA